MYTCEFVCVHVNCIFFKQWASNYQCNELKTKSIFDTANVEKCGSNMEVLSYSSRHYTAQYQDIVLMTSCALM